MLSLSKRGKPARVRRLTATCKVSSEVMHGSAFLQEDTSQGAGIMCCLPACLQAHICIHKQRAAGHVSAPRTLLASWASVLHLLAHTPAA
jgi:hypothetical protein